MFVRKIFLFSTFQKDSNFYLSCPLANPAKETLSLRAKFKKKEVGVFSLP